MRRLQLLALLAALCLALAACGGDDDDEGGDSADKGGRTEQTETTDSKGGDPNVVPDNETSAKAKSDVGTTVAAVTACYADAQDYTQCEDVAVPGVELGVAPGQVTINADSASAYTVTAVVEGGNFIYRTDETGTVERLCSAGKPGCSKQGDGELGSW